MDFFAAKADAMRRSRRLEWLFALAVAVCVGVLTHFTCSSIGIQLRRGWIPYGVIASLWLLAIIVPWLKKQRALRSGGAAVAESLGGTRVETAPHDPLLRRLRNVVEEIAIASGIPVPAVYVLEDETSINAFAAGHRPVDAAIAVTRGALDNLTRDELQGVVAHEFSHILNGDMALNTRMIGWIAGLGGITAIGYALLRPRRQLRVSSMMKFAVVLLVIGAVGTFAGRLLQAAVSRQREWLADAAAVQFTRNPSGLRNALLRIAHVGERSLAAPDAASVAHLLLISDSKHAWFATHPPLRRRIAALGTGPDTPPPNLQQQAVTAGRTSAMSQSPHEGHAPVLSAAPAEELPQTGIAGPHAPESVARAEPRPFVETGALGPAEAVIAAIAHPGPEQLAEAREIVQALPEFVHAAAASTEAARGLVLALLVSPVSEERARQLAAIELAMGHKVAQYVRTALSLVTELAPPLRLPAVLELIGPLAMTGGAEHISLANLVHHLAIADGEIDIFEFCVRRLVVKSLEPADDRAKARPPRSLAEAAPAVAVLLGVVARHGARGDEDATRRAFLAGVTRLNLAAPPEYSVPPSWSAALWSALDEIDGVDALAQRDILRALVATIAHDGRLVREESELLQLACIAIGCPVPPLSALIRDDLTVLN